MIKVGSIVRRKLHGTLKYRVAEITPDGCGPGGATARLTVVDDVWNIRDRHEWVDNLVLADDQAPSEVQAEESKS